MNRLTTGLGIALAIGTFSWADSTPPAVPPPPMASPTPVKPVGPCKEILAACSAAGFVKGEYKEGKGLFKDCFDPIRNGQSVANVTVDPATVTACNQKIQARKAKQQAAGGSEAPAAPPAAESAAQ